jgi:hypothetical protein
MAVGLLYHVDVLGDAGGSTTIGSGVPATQSRDVPAFDSVELAGGNSVMIRSEEGSRSSSRRTTTSFAA